ncbi:MAG TPA: hypothetical protein VH482_06320 [Thermomicrobiales bacterium]|jgi:hypothetical protein
MSRGVRIFFRGLSDTLENLLQFVLCSLSWWLCCLTVVLAPGAVVALFAAADPRITSGFDRPGPRAFVADAVRHLRRGWKLTLVAAPILALLTYNLWFYGAADSRLSLLTPAWFVLLVIGSLIALSAFSIVALLDEPPLSALRAAAVLTGARVGHALVVGLLLYALIVLGGLLVVPLFMFLPATVAATIDRLVLDGLRIPIHDPLAPTDERRVEELVAKDRKRFGP